MLNVRQLRRNDRPLLEGFVAATTVMLGAALSPVLRQRGALAAALVLADRAVIHTSGLGVPCVELFDFLECLRQ